MSMAQIPQCHPQLSPTVPHPLTDGELGQGAAQALSNGLQFLQLCLLPPALFAQDLVLQPLVSLGSRKGCCGGIRVHQHLAQAGYPQTPWVVAPAVPAPTGTLQSPWPCSPSSVNPLVPSQPWCSSPSARHGSRGGCPHRTFPRRCHRPVGTRSWLQHLGTEQNRGMTPLLPAPPEAVAPGLSSTGLGEHSALGGWEGIPTVLPILWKSSGSCTSTFSRWNMWYSACSQIGGIRLNCRATEYASCRRARTVSALLLPPSPLPNPPAKS